MAIHWIDLLSRHLGTIKLVNTSKNFIFIARARSASAFYSHSASTSKLVLFILHEPEVRVHFIFVAQVRENKCFSHYTSPQGECSSSLRTNQFERVYFIYVRFLGVPANIMVIQPLNEPGVNAKLAK